ncbi:hypothetical protein I9018_09405 [Pseudomonas sp. MPFS]|uniref:hypothetical protein n=1 Tax=Pseudomonas sp. MPFS TaxID=2795724 RepID=UPI001F13CE77|nr:hypothetical protein [Pseudomonas sp. MPFS]UMZ13895.1 hypothetical protein I9018_09405 [Pseudomonas sp. MPFS]
MKHQQLLEKLAARHLVQALDEDLARLAWRAMVAQQQGHQGSLNNAVLPSLLARWNCVLLADESQVAPLYRHKAWLALATLLHKYGLAEPSITARAVEAIEELNRAVALGDKFHQRSQEFSAGLQAPPVALARKPALPDSITFYRAGDVLAIQLEGRFYAAYVHRLGSINESPIIEFYAQVFDQVPTLEQLQQTPAQGELYNDGIRRKSLYGVSGIKFQPDPAGQVTLIAACVAHPPDSSHLAPSVGLYAVSDILRIQDTIRRMFEVPVPATAQA